jgi:hypothetical protein
MGTKNLFELYKKANEEAVDIFLQANYEDELLDVKRSEWLHEGQWMMEGPTLNAIQNTGKTYEKT